MDVDTPLAVPQAPVPKRLQVTVNKPTPYTFDLGMLMANDPNPLEIEDDLEESLAATTRDGAQALLNQLLSACPIQSTDAGVLLSLPAVETPLPREKPLPPAKQQTKWERFAAKKGIKPKTKEARSRMVFDEATGEYVPRWGYKGANKGVEKDWIVEVDPKKEAAGKPDPRGEARQQRKERVKRQERQMRANERKTRKPGRN